MPALNIPQDTLDAAAQVIANSLPEYRALQERLARESVNVRRGVVNTLIDWAWPGPSQEQRIARLAELKAEMRRRKATTGV